MYARCCHKCLIVNAMYSLAGCWDEVPAASLLTRYMRLCTELVHKIAWLGTEVHLLSIR